MFIAMRHCRRRALILEEGVLTPSMRTHWAFLDLIGNDTFVWNLRECKDQFSRNDRVLVYAAICTESYLFGGMTSS